MSLWEEYLPHIIGFFYILILILVTVRILIKRRSVGVTLAWLFLTFSIPLVGIGFYVVFGELRLGSKHAKRAKAQREYGQRWLVEQSLHEPEVDISPKSNADIVSKLVYGRESMPTTIGNRSELFEGAYPVFDALIVDINNAQSSIWMEFYILELKGRVVDVVDALVEAVQRGVDVYICLDSAGSLEFFRSKQASELRQKGVNIAEMFPVNAWRLWLERQDLRLHRKIIAIDSDIAWTGSMNMVDPAEFKKDAGVGEWYDSMLRIEGRVSHYLKSIVVSDWHLETGENFSRFLDITEPVSNEGEGIMQACPSGPASPDDSVEEVLLSAIYGARKNILMITPYFVPGEALIAALKTASHRGVKIELTVPKKNDSKMAGLASASYFEELVSAGVIIRGFENALLHSKVVIVDDNLALFGSVNLDMRSFWLNFEVTTLIYDKNTIQQLVDMVGRVNHGSPKLILTQWRKRGLLKKLAEQIAHLFSPLL